MEGTVTRLTYIFLLCVWLVLCRLIWDSGLFFKGNNSNNSKPLNWEDWMNLAPSVMSSLPSASALATELEEVLITESTKQKAVKERSHSDMEAKQLTPEQEEQLKDLIDFTLGDEIEREDLNAEEVQGILNLAIADAQEAYGKLNLRRRR
ncbi:unnamed protein product [Cylindrotheca closterium]|uniref:Uncharacterized protein n=1 Tax=Cylindrotheca closterium TaxID=2856 RepID=A0AAD2CTP4_9STRA|nr:unnamed protein product [Cylindrotheca closterium]